MNANETVKNSLLSIVDQIDAGNSNINEDDCLKIVEFTSSLVNTKQKLSKYQACKYLQISRATFDNWVKDGKIPQGKKEQGFKEKFWELKDLKNVIKN